MLIRSPIVAVLGHVDHGKTSLLDAIRGTGVAKKEAGGITQMIGASYVSRETIEDVSKMIAERMKIKLVIPGILFIDTPGHEAFTTLRERGGSIADIAILVVDIAQGLQPQTIESIKILKNAKTPFIVAANKLDLVDGWKSNKTDSFLESFEKQPEFAKEKLDMKIYELMGRFSEYGLDSERFDRVIDFTKQVAIIPVSAKTREGLAELLLLLSGLSQRFLEKDLHVNSESPARGSVIEVKEEKGMGSTLDVIMYDGILRESDEIIYYSTLGVKRVKVRAILLPSIEGSKEKFKRVQTIVAAAGIKISAPDLGDAVNGSPLVVVSNYEKDKDAIESQMKSILFESQGMGVVVKADSLGSVEALLKLLADAKIPVKSANVGSVSKMDVIMASTVSSEDKYLGIVLAFNVPVLTEAKSASESCGAPILYSNIIYQLLDHYEEWKAEEREKEKTEVLEKMPWPCSMKVLRGCFFRASKPAIFGVEVVSGKLRPHFRLMNASGAILGEVKVIQKDKESLQEALRGVQAAISIEDIVLGKDLKEGETLFTYIGKQDIAKWNKKLDALSEEERMILSQVEDLLCVRI